LSLWPEAGDQVGWVHFERFGDSRDVIESDVDFPALYVTDVGAVESCALGESLLGQGRAVSIPMVHPALAHPVAEKLGHGMVGALHSKPSQRAVLHPSTAHD